VRPRRHGALLRGPSTSPLGSMLSTPMYLARHVLPPLLVALLVLVLLRLVRLLAPARWLAVVGVSITQLLLYFLAFFVWGSLADADGAPWALAAAVRVLAFPFTYLISLAGLPRYLDNDSTVFVFAPILNAVVWGIALIWLWSLLRTRMPPNNRWRGP